MTEHQLNCTAVRINIQNKYKEMCFVKQHGFFVLFWGGFSCIDCHGCYYSIYSIVPFHYAPADGELKINNKSHDNINESDCRGPLVMYPEFVIHLLTCGNFL